MEDGPHVEVELVLTFVILRIFLTFKSNSAAIVRYLNFVLDVYSLPFLFERALSLVLSFSSVFAKELVVIGFV